MDDCPCAIWTQMGTRMGTPGTGKHMWIRFPEISASYGDQDTARNKIVEWANEKGFTVCSSYFMEKSGVAINFAYPHHVDEIARRGHVTIPGLKAPIKTMRLHQIEVQNAFEMVITSVPTEYEDMDLLILKWLREKFQNEGQHTSQVLVLPQMSLKPWSFT